MADKSTKNLEESETVTLLLEVLFEKCEPEFEWDISEPYIYGDHPDHGGGRIQRDIEGVTFVGMIGFSRSETIRIFGNPFVIAAENHALENYEKYCSEEL